MENQPSQITLVIGGCRSGKSGFAQQLAEKISPKNRLYLATCIPQDPEMTDRIKRHQSQRGPSWKTVEVPLDIAGTIDSHSKKEQVILIDCLTLWVTNLILKHDTDRQILAEADQLSAALKRTQATVILVSNEVGMGIVPENDLARRFRDIAGLVNQKIATCADQVVLMTAGIPISVKGRLT